MARQSLQTVLDSWQRGEKPEGLKHGSPAIVAIDHDWQAGVRLAGYTVKDAQEPRGTSLRCYVVLSLQDGAGKTIEKETSYTIGTSSTITVVRDDLDESEQTP